jgi:hypothetical protein
MKPDEVTNFFTVDVVKLWHTVDGVYMCACRGMSLRGTWDNKLI